MANATNLRAAKAAKNDEFYTRLADIENELKHYKPFFKGKTVLLNCGDAPHRNFWKYFAMNFEHLGLKKLIGTSFTFEGQGTVSVYEGDRNGNRNPDDEEIVTRPLQGNGDFRSEECIELLKEADVVVGNPPFSLFREYVAQLMEYGKKFLIIGNTNAITYKEIFPYIKENKLWLGYGFQGGNAYFIYNGDGSCYADGVYDPETKLVKFRNCSWFTNIEHDKRHQPLDLYKKYYSNECEFPKYDNYDAIEVGRVSDIPMDYDGVMGVPITFLDKYCPDQFEIVGITENADYLKPYRVDGCLKYDRPYLNGKRMYSRLLIRRYV